MNNCLNKLNQSYFDLINLFFVQYYFFLDFNNPIELIY